MFSYHGVRLPYCEYKWASADINVHLSVCVHSGVDGGQLHVNPASQSTIIVGLEALELAQYNSPCGSFVCF